MIKRNIFVFKFYYLFWRFKPLATLMVVYFSQIMESYASAMAVFSIFNISYAIAKLPSGLLSDKIGRKPIIILANSLIFISFLMLAISGQFNIKYGLYIFALLWGIGEALSVGTVDALMFETSQELGQEDKFKLLYAKSMYYDQLGCALGAFCAMTITYFLPLQFVAWLSIFPPFIQLASSVLFVEPHIKRKSISISAKDIYMALGQFKDNTKLAFYTLADIYFSTLGDISHRLESAYFKIFTNDWIVNLARMFKHIFGMIGFAIIPCIKRFSRTQIYFGSIVGNVFIRTIALLLNNICTPFIHMFINFFYATASTAKTDILQHEFLQAYRATAQSVIQFIKGIYMAVIMYLLGIFADTYGIFSAMILLVVLRLVGLVVFGFIPHFCKKSRLC